MTTSTLASSAPAEHDGGASRRLRARPEPMVLWTLGGIGAGALSLWHTPPSGIRLVLVLAFVLTAPGCAALVWWRRLSRPARAAVPPVLGLSVIILTTTAEAFAKFWYPSETLLAVGGVSLASVLVRVAFGPTAYSKPLAAPPGGSELDSEPPGDRRAAAHRATAGYGRWVIPVILVLALVSWLLCLPTVGHARVSAYGLLGSASPFYAISIGLSGLAGVVALARRSVPGLLAAAGALIVTERLTTAISTAVPLYAWTYKHVAVVDYIDKFHYVVRGTDIYQDWPGLFSTTAWVHQLTGVAPITIAHWFTPVYHVGLVALIYAAARAWQRTPLVAAAAAFVFEACSFVQQDYFSPQATAYLLGIGTLLLLGESSRRRAAALPALVLFAAITVTHQLTPYWLIIVAALLVALRRVKPWWLPIGFAAMAGTYLVLNYAAVKKYGPVSSGNPVENIRLTSTASPVFGIRTQFYAIVAMYLILFGSAGIALLISLVRKREWRAPACLAFSSVLLLAVQGYGGEAIFRIALYALPGLSVVAATISLRGFARSRLLAGVTALVTLLTVGIAAHATGGSYSAYRVSASEIAVWKTFNRQAPLLAFFNVVGPGFPANPEWYYAPRITNNSSYASVLFGSDSSVATNFASKASYEDLMSLIVSRTSQSTAPFYFVLSDADQHYGHLYGVLPNGLTANLRRHMRQDPRWQLIQDAGSSQLFKLR